MITPISSNEAKTVGLCKCDNEKSDFVGKFSTVLLKEWVEMVVKNFGADTIVYLYSHHSGNPDNTTRVLSASATHGDSIQVMAVGVNNNDVFGKEITK